MTPLALSGLFNIGEKLIDKLFTSDEDKAKAHLELLRLQQSGELAVLDANMRIIEGQLNINKAEASSLDSYRAGWRPTIGYIAAGALAFQYLLNPLLIWCNTIFQWGITTPDIGLDSNLWELIMGMLGLGGLRTYEKLKGK